MPPGPGDDALWEAVADPTRRRLIDLLVANGDATATALAADLPVTRQAISKHLTVLDRVGLVEGHRHGREVRYRIREERLAEASGALSDAGARWAQRLRAIKALAEAAHAAGADGADGADRAGGAGGADPTATAGPGPE